VQITQKLDYFEEVMQREAAMVQHQVQRERSQRHARGVTAALEEAQIRIEARILEQTQQIKKENYIKIAKALAEARQTLWLKRQLNTRNLFDEAEARLRAFIISEEYEPYLEKTIEAVATASGLHEVTREEGNLGGFTLHNEARTQRVDFTFKTRLNKAMETFEAHGEG